jgi:alpha-L-fucosidase 2
MKDKKIVNSYPATKWKDATPLGNGRLGCCVYGAIYDERLLINHEELYNGAINLPLPDISSELKTVRKLMDDKDYFKANHYYVNSLKQKNYFANKGSFYPAFDLHIINKTECAFENYSRELDMTTGISTVSYIDNNSLVKRETFVSQKDNCIVVHFEKQSKSNISFSLEQHDFTDLVDYYGNSMNFDGKIDSMSKDKYIYTICKTAGGISYSGIVKVLETDGEIISNGKDRKVNIDMQGEEQLHNYIRISNANYATIIINVESCIKTFDELKKDIDLINKSYEILKLEQINIFSNIFNSTTLSICNDETLLSNEQLLLNSYNGNVEKQLIEKMADFGRYLLISSSYNCSLPANLQGLWNGDYSPAWACTFFNNENIQMEYWQAFAGNLSNAVLPLFNLYDKFKEDYRQNAQKLYGCRGILLPLFMDNQSGKKDNLQAHVLYWTGSSAWISAIYYDYYLYTLDEEFLLERAYPFMKETALFYEDFMVEDENGYLKSYPSNSPENRANGRFMGAKEVSVCINATMDFALLKELLTNLLSISDKYNIDIDKAKEWEIMLNKIPEYEINEEGAIKEWLNKDFQDNYHHRHQSHIYPLFPGQEVTKENNDKIFNAINMAVQKRLCIGLKEQTGWSFAHMANIFARLCDGEKAKECLELIIRFCTGENLFTYHNDWRNMGVTLKYMNAKQAPFQIDANMGFTSAIYEMLLYGNSNIIKLLPALPKDWRDGRVENIQVRGGINISIWWNDKQVKTEIISKIDCIKHIGLYNFQKITSNEIYEESCYGKEFIKVSLLANKKLILNYQL